MGVRVVMEHARSLTKDEFFFKTIGEHLSSVPRGRMVKECRLDVDIKSKKDIEIITEFLNNLAPSFNTK